MDLKRTYSWAVATLIFLPFLASANVEINNAPSRPKNIVIMIGDGMGPAYTSAYRYFRDNADTEEIEQTVFDRLLVGMASTYPAKESGYVTDSAASATALATGVKSYNGAISVDINKRPLTTIMQMAKAKGMSIGVAVTSQVNHATPAAFLTHNENRRHYDEIAASYLHTQADVILGGGQKYFSAALLEQFKNKGYQNIDNLSQLDNITQGKVLGLFAQVQLPWAIDDNNIDTLSRLTQKSLDLLSQNDNGFVLLVEGSLIDWAGHNNDIVAAMAEMHSFANAMEVVEQYVRQHPDTLLVATADHNTGGLSIGANGHYRWDTELLKKITESPARISSAALTDENWQSAISQSLGLTLTTSEQQQLSQARAKGDEALQSALNTLIDTRSHTGWTTGGHTAGDVQVFAIGPAADLFKGSQDNTNIAEKVMSLLPK
ncbi:alkaline phosphatase [Shewanella sp.]|nr:alkaline phosphatase [Shewanella sp.]